MIYNLYISTTVAARLRYCLLDTTYERAVESRDMARNICNIKLRSFRKAYWRVVNKSLEVVIVFVYFNINELYNHAII